MTKALQRHDLGGNQLNYASNASSRLRLKRDHQFEAYILTGFFLVMAALSSLFPPSGDDWAWGSQIGEDRLSAHFQNYNGRYAGNFAVLLLTRASFFAPLIVAAVLTLTIFLIVDLTNNRTVLGYSAIILLFLSMPQGSWRQSIVWMSGFSNYAISGLCVLLFFRSLKSVRLDSAQQSIGAGRLFAVFCLGFVSSLFMEHVTLYLLLASSAAFIAIRVRAGRYSKICLCWVLSSACGAALMFSNGAYTAAAKKGGPGNYQQIGAGADKSALSSLVAKAVDVVSVQAVTDNILLNFVIAVLVCALIGANANSLSRRTKTVLLVAVAAFVAITSALPTAENYLTLRLAIRSLNAAGALLLLFVLILAALQLAKRPSSRLQLLIYSGSIITLIAPMFVVNPVGPRCFYPTYLIFLLIVGTLLKDLTRGAETSVASRWVSPVLGIFVFSSLVSQFMIYGVIHHAAQERISEIRTQVAQGATTVTVKRLPFPGYVHMPDPAGELWSHRYKLYYGLPGDLKIVVVDRP